MRQRGLGRIYQRKGTSAWWIQYHVRGKVHRESSGSDNENVAAKLLRKRLAEIETGKLVGPTAERTTFEDLAAMILNDYAVNNRRSTERVENTLKHLRPVFGNARAMDITTDRIKEYIRNRQEEGAALGSIGQELATLRRCFSLAIQAERLAWRPYIPFPRLQNARKGFFELAEYSALQAQLPPYLSPLVEFLWLTGWRSGEVCSLQWSQVDFDAGIVRIEVGESKNDDGREFPFSALPALESLLRRQREETTSLERSQGRLIPWVFHRNGKPIKNFRKVWKRAVTAAKIPLRIPHDFRRTAVRRLERAGVPRSVAMKLVGHKTESVYRRYAIVAEADLREGVAKLANLHAATLTHMHSKNFSTGG